MRYYQFFLDNIDNNRLDKSHHTEYTLESFKKEIESAGLKLQFYSIQFGEIWAKCESI